MSARENVPVMVSNNDIEQTIMRDTEYGGRRGRLVFIAEPANTEVAHANTLEKVVEQPSLVDRNMDFDNVLGNLLIAELQVERLRQRMADMLARGMNAPVYGTVEKASSNQQPRIRSLHHYKYGGKWYRILTIFDVVESPTNLTEEDIKNMQ